MLPKPKHKLGYTGEEVNKICKDRKIDIDIFWEEFGVNTVGVAKDGKVRYYPQDIEKTLYNLKKSDGVYHCWD